METSAIKRNLKTQRKIRECFRSRVERSNRKIVSASTAIENEIFRRKLLIMSLMEEITLVVVEQSVFHLNSKSVFLSSGSSIYFARSKPQNSENKLLNYPQNNIEKDLNELN